MRLPRQTRAVVRHDIRAHGVEHRDERARPGYVGLVGAFVLLDDAIRIELRAVLHIADVRPGRRLDGDPAEGRHALTDGRKVGKEGRVAAVRIAKVDDALDSSLERLEERGQGVLLRLAAHGRRLDHMLYLVHRMSHQLGMLAHEGADRRTRVLVRTDGGPHVGGPRLQRRRRRSRRHRHRLGLLALLRLTRLRNHNILEARSGRLEALNERRQIPNARRHGGSGEPMSYVARPA